MPTIAIAGDTPFFTMRGSGEIDDVAAPSEGLDCAGLEAGDCAEAGSGAEAGAFATAAAAEAGAACAAASFSFFASAADRASMIAELSRGRAREAACVPTDPRGFRCGAPVGVPRLAGRREPPRAPAAPALRSP